MNEPIPLQPTPTNIPKLDHKSWLARHLLAEVLAVVVVVTLTATGLYYKSLLDEPIINPPVHRPINRTATINSFTTCAAAGNVIMETYPEQCRTSDGVTFVKQYQACIQVITPAKNPQTQEVRNFPTPCDVPVGWVKVSGSPQ